jgi:hypothetical protein
MSNPKKIQKIFNLLDEDYIAIAWDGIEPLLIINNQKMSNKEEEMCQMEFIKGSHTDQVFDSLWNIFEGAKPIRYNRHSDD